MELMTEEIKQRLLEVGEDGQSGRGEKSEVIVKYFNPLGVGTWLVVDGKPCDNGDWLLFGYHSLSEEWEWGNIRLSELQEVRLPLGLSIERDLYFKGTVEEHQKLHGYE